MLQISSTLNYFPALRRLNGFAAIVAASLLTAGSAFAGTAEVNALTIILAQQDVTIATASGDQLANAVVAAINANPTLKAGVIAGEALKGAGSNAPDAGAKIGAAVFPVVGPANQFTVAADAAKTAATGKGPNSSQVPTFEQVIISSNNDAVAIATKVKTVANAVGAIFGGAALDLNTDVAKLALADSAVKNKNFKKAVQSIAQYVGAATADSDQFAVDLSTRNVGSTISIATGVSAGVPTNAGAIVSGIVNDPGLTSVLKKASSLAKSVAKVADIEQIEIVGAAIGAKIGTGAIKISQLNAIAKGLVAGVTSKATTQTGANRLVNKTDEIGEIGAVLMNAIGANSAFTATTTKAANKAAKIVVGLLKTIVGGSKSKTDTALQALVAPDVAGSVALTAKSFAFNATVALAIKNALTNAKNIKSIGGKALAASITAAINEVYAAAGDVQKYENGTLLPTTPNDPGTGPVVDPETESRNG